jgi:hypothetical protein
MKFIVLHIDPMTVISIAQGNIHIANQAMINGFSILNQLKLLNPFYLLDIETLCNYNKETRPIQLHSKPNDFLKQEN